MAPARPVHWILSGAGAACLAMVLSCGQPAPHSPPGPPGIARTTNAYHACLLCHSHREMQRGPVLNGLPAWYVALQMNKFQDGRRGKNPDNRSERLMGAAIQQVIAPEEIKRMAQFIADLPVQTHRITVRGDIARGKALYQACIPCHGARGEGNPAVKGSPLTMLEDWYLLDQMRKFKSGLRGYHPQDTEGRIMALSVQPLTDTDLRDVIRYVATELATRGQPPD